MLEGVKEPNEVSKGLGKMFQVEGTMEPWRGEERLGVLEEKQAVWLEQSKQERKKQR